MTARERAVGWHVAHAAGPGAATSAPPSRSRGHRTVIDDTLATTAVFDIDWETRPPQTDPEGVRIGNAVAAALLRKLEEAERTKSADVQVDAIREPL